MVWKEKTRFDWWLLKTIFISFSPSLSHPLPRHATPNTLILITLWCVVRRLASHFPTFQLIFLLPAYKIWHTPLYDMWPNLNLNSINLGSRLDCDPFGINQNLFWTDPLLKSRRTIIDGKKSFLYVCTGSWNSLIRPLKENEKRFDI